VLAEYHRVIGARVHEYGGNARAIHGDGAWCLQRPEVRHPAESAVRMSIDIRDACASCRTIGRRNGHDLGWEIGIAQKLRDPGAGSASKAASTDASDRQRGTKPRARLCGDDRALAGNASQTACSRPSSG